MTDPQDKDQRQTLAFLTYIIYGHSYVNAGISLQLKEPTNLQGKSSIYCM